jgi:hypothetical protein
MRGEQIGRLMIKAHHTRKTEQSKVEARSSPRHVDMMTRTETNVVTSARPALGNGAISGVSQCVMDCVRLPYKVADRFLHEINDVSVDVSTKPTNGDVREIMLHIRCQGP